jgi:hypothetical protein
LTPPSPAASAWPSPPATARTSWPPPPDRAASWGFTGGIFVALGDLNGDGDLEVVSGPDAAPNCDPCVNGDLEVVAGPNCEFLDDRVEQSSPALIRYLVC